MSNFFKWLMILIVMAIIVTIAYKIRYVLGYFIKSSTKKSMNWADTVNEKYRLKLEALNSQDVKKEAEEQKKSN